jgi:hypothetical protein
VIAGIVAAGAIAALVAVLGGGGSAAGTIVKRLSMPDDASVLTANRKTAFVSGAGGTLTEVDLDDGKDAFPVHGLGTIDLPAAAPQGRSVALTGTEIWIDDARESIVHFAWDAGPDAHFLPVPRSSYHGLAASRDALWVLSPDASEVSRLPNGSTKPDSAAFSIPAGSATQLAVTDRSAYVLYSKGDAAHQRILTVKRDLTEGTPPALGLAGRAIRTGDDFLMVLHDDTLALESTLPGGPRRSIKVGAGARGFDFNAGRLWVTYADGTLKRFSSTGEAAGDPLELGGQPLAVDARDDRAWVLVRTDEGKRQLLDVRP